MAAGKGHADCLEIIAQTAPDSLGIPRDDGVTPAYVTAQEGHADCLEIIAQTAPDSLGIPRDNGITSAWMAAQEGHADCLEIIAQTAPDSLGISRDDGMTPAHVAAQEGHAECVGTIADYDGQLLEAQVPSFVTKVMRILRGYKFDVLGLAYVSGHKECVRIIHQKAQNPRLKQKAEKFLRKMQ
jgi:hypothetical protein